MALSGHQRPLWRGLCRDLHQARFQAPGHHGVQQRIGPGQCGRLYPRLGKARRQGHGARHLRTQPPQLPQRAAEDSGHQARCDRDGLVPARHHHHPARVVPVGGGYQVDHPRLGGQPRSGEGPGRRGVRRHHLRRYGVQRKERFLRPLRRRLHQGHGEGGFQKHLRRHGV